MDNLVSSLSINNLVESLMNLPKREWYVYDDPMCYITHYFDPLEIKLSKQRFNNNAYISIGCGAIEFMKVFESPEINELYRYMENKLK